MRTANKTKILSIASLLSAYAVGALVETGLAAPNSVLRNEDRPEASANNVDLRSAVLSLINYFLGFLGLVAVIVIIISGVKLVASQGNDTAVKNAQKTIGYAALGLLIVFFAYAIVNFIVNIVA